MSTAPDWSDWVTEVCRQLDIRLVDPAATTTQILDLTAQVAHGVARPAAPVTAFLVGLAAGGSDRPDELVAQLSRRLGERADAWAGPHGSGPAADTPGHG